LLSNDELEALKKPAGLLIKDNEIDEKIKDHLTNLIISIGDATTDRLLSMNIIPDIQIVDGKERRYTREPAGKYYITQLRCKNPAGSITIDAIKIFKEALDAKKPVRILVEGEEDLFGLIALAYAPKDATILYGQPLEGIVIMKIKIRDRFKNMVDKIITLEGE
jgi:hypothetical protein